jgi:hypothetical protein
LDLPGGGDGVSYSPERSDGTGGGGDGQDAGHAEIGVVEEVERLGAELQTSLIVPFGEIETLQ